MDSPSSNKEERYSLAGKNLGDCLIQVRDGGGNNPILGAMNTLCARLYYLIYDEGLTVKEALDEIGRQTSGGLYLTRFWLELTDNLVGNATLPPKDKDVAEILISYLSKLCHEHLGDEKPRTEEAVYSLKNSPILTVVDQRLIVFDNSLSQEIETALSIESADMVLLTLRRIDECILIAPHMVSAWKKLLERLSQLDPTSARKYCAEMSLYWDPYKAQRKIQEADVKYAGHPGLDSYKSFINGAQAIGNELDTHGTKMWTKLTLGRISEEPLDRILDSILGIFPLAIYSKGFCRTSFGVSTSIFQSVVNSDFRKRAAETYILILKNLIPEEPEEGILLIYAVMDALIGEDYTSVMESFFEQWKSCIESMAPKNIDDALMFIDTDERFTAFNDKKKVLRESIITTGGNEISEKTPGPSTAFQAAEIWCFATERKQVVNIWKQIILQGAQKNPELAVHEIYTSIGPFASTLKEVDGEIFLAKQLTEVLTIIIDSVAERDTVRALRICIHVLREEHYALVCFSQQALSQRVTQYAEQLSVSHPDLVLDGYVLIDWSIEWSNQWKVPGIEYMSGVETRHASILELIPRAAQKSLLVAVNACERLLLFSDEESQIYNQVLVLWRRYMNQLEKRHTATAKIRYSDFLGRIKNRQHSLAIEADNGYERCCANEKLQSHTIMPTGNPGN